MLNFFMLDDDINEMPQNQPGGEKWAYEIILFNFFTLAEAKITQLLSSPAGLPGKKFSEK